METWKWVIPVLCVMAEFASCGNDKAQANGYDAAWKDAWIQHARQVLGSGPKTSGFVLQIGDSITHDSAYSEWPRAGAGRTAEDSAFCAWAHASDFSSSPNDASNKNGFYLAVANTASGYRGMTASRGMTTREFINGDGNSGPAMPAESNPGTARSLVSNAVYTGNLNDETVASAFSDAQSAVLMLGTNDIYAGETAAQFAAHLGALMDLLESKNIICVISTIPPIYDTALNNRVLDYNTQIRALAQNRSLALIDFHAEILARRPGTSWNGTLMVANDVHPSVSAGGYNASSDAYADGGDSAAHRTGNACSNVGYLLRSWLTVQKLKDVRDLVINAIPAVRLSVSAASVNENAGSLTLNAVLEFASARTISVNVATSSGSASSGVDFQGINTTLTFSPGVTSKTVTIPVTNDTLDEASETFTLNLSNAVNATLGSPSAATITIQDDDPAPSVRFEGGLYVISESTANESLAVLLSAPSGLAVSVSYTTNAGTANGGDYSSRSGTLSFQPGETRKTIDVPILNDALDEDEESFSVSLTNPVHATMGSPATATVFIQDNDAEPAVSVEAPSYLFSEASGQAQMDLILNAPSGREVTSSFETAEGTAGPGDYVSQSGSVTFQPGETRKTVSIQLINDALNEENETFAIEVLSASHAVLGAATRTTVTITDNDPPPSVTFKTGASSISESGAAAVVEMVLNTASGRAVSVTCSASNGSAEADDYTGFSKTVTFPPGQTTQTIELALVNDVFDEGDETVELKLSNPQFATLGLVATHVVTIEDDDTARVQFSERDISVSEAAGTVNVQMKLSTISSSAIQATVSVTGGTAKGDADFTLSGPSVVFAPGETSKTVAVNVVNDPFREGNENLVLSLSGPAGTVFGANTTSQLTIVDDEAPVTVQFGAADFSCEESDGIAEIKVKLNGPSSLPVRVRVGSADDSAIAARDYETIGADLVFEPGEVEKNFQVRILDDILSELPEKLTLGLSHVEGASLGANSTATLTITDKDANRLPRVESAAAATPIRPYPREAVTFSVAASDVDEQALAYLWDFGDGTFEAGSNAQHAYSAPGRYEAWVTIGDSVATTLSRVTVNVRPLHVANPVNADDDSDGFSDELETSLGSDPLDAESFPAGKLNSAPMQSGKLKVSLNFKKPDSDTLAFSAVLSLPRNSVADQVLIDVGGVIQAVAPAVKTKGRAASGVTVRTNAASRTMALKMTVRGSLAARFADEGLTAAAALESQRKIQVTVRVIQGGQNFFFKKEFELKYTAKSGRGFTQ